MITNTSDAAARAQDALRRVWGYDSFRPLQAEVISDLMNGRDVLVVLPTGGGKSLCYQVPAVVAGPALIVSPLISLMQDQVAALTQLGVRAAFLNSSLSADESREVLQRWRRGELSMLYAAPERILLSSFREMLLSSPPTFVAVDEAHCISHWGHDFRPDYRGLNALRQDLADVPFLALTATATPEVRVDILVQLGLHEAAVHVGDVFRPNLNYRVERRTNRNQQLTDILTAHKGRSGIVYCISRNDTEQVAEHLCRSGFRCAAYHAGLSQALRREVQAMFAEETLDAVVATVAFGMGIDRSNVRFVVHCGMPKSIEHYQQETGRAGRDGLRAECVMLYSGADIVKWRTIMESADPPSPPDILEIGRQKLKEIADYASRRGCRHRALVEYFGQTFTRENCGNCDVCEGTVGGGATHPDSTVIAQKILSCVVRLNNGYGTAYVIKVLRGLAGAIQPVHCGLSTFGILSETSNAQLRLWVDDCLQSGLLARSEGEYPVLSVTASGWRVLKGEAHAQLTPEVAREARKRQRSERIASHRSAANETAGLSAEDQRRFEALREMRTRLAKERKVPAYLIFHDATLRSIAIANPSSELELGAVSGVGEAKLSAYGAAVLETLRNMP